MGLLILTAGIRRHEAPAVKARLFRRIRRYDSGVAIHSSRRTRGIHSLAKVPTPISAQNTTGTPPTAHRSAHVLSQRTLTGERRSPLTGEKAPAPKSAVLDSRCGALRG